MKRPFLSEADLFCDGWETGKPPTEDGKYLVTVYTGKTWYTDIASFRKNRWWKREKEIVAWKKLPFPYIITPTYTRGVETRTPAPANR